jgi:hypothetical protein
MKKLSCLLTFMFLFTSCATIFTGGKAMVRIDSKDVKSATVLVNGLEKGSTPVSLKLKADDMITLEKDGYDSKTVTVDSKFNSIAILNLFSLLGWGIDAITNSLKIPDTRMYTMSLKKQE